MFTATLLPILFSFSNGGALEQVSPPVAPLSLDLRQSDQEPPAETETEASPDLGDDMLDDVYAEDPAAEETTAEAPADDKEAEMAAARARKGDRYNQWGLHVAPTFSYLRGFKGAWTALGGGGRIGAWKMGWRQNFMIGGGPVLVFNYFKDKANNDTILGATFNGDLIVGGGKADKFAVYGHLTLGLGVVSFKDGATGVSGVLPWGQGRLGVGGHYYVNEKISVGLLTDFGGGFSHLAVDAMLTLGVHFGKTG